MQHNLFPAEAFEEIEEQCTFDARLVLRRRNECEALEVDTAIGNGIDQHRRPRVIQNALMLFKQIEHELAGLLRIGVNRNTESDFNATDRLGRRHVADRLGDQLRIGDDQCGAVGDLDLRCPDADFLHIPFVRAHPYRIADLERSFGEQDQAGNEVLRDGLKAKANSGVGASIAGEFQSFYSIGF